MNASGFLFAFRGTTATVLGTATLALQTNVWYYIEVKYKVDDTTGVVVVKLNGSTTLINLSNQDTQNGGTAVADAIHFFGDTGSNWDFGDIYILATDASPNNNFLGDTRVQMLLPTANGATNDFTPSAGSNFQNVDDASPDDDATYNEASNQGDMDLYQFGNLSGSPTVFAVQACLMVRKDDAGSQVVREKCRTNASNFTGTNVALSTGYTVIREVRNINPDSSGAWTATEVNDTEWGIEIDV